MKKSTSEWLGVAGVALSAASFSGLSIPSIIDFANRLHVSPSGVVDLRLLALYGGAAASAKLVNLAVERNVPPVLSTYPKTTRATVGDLPAFRNMLLEEFGESEVPTLDAMKQWHRKNRNIFQLCFDVNIDTGERSLVGGFKAVPIDDRLVLAIEWGQCTRGSDIPVENIVNARSAPSGWWIGDLVSTGAKHNQFVTRSLRDFFVRKLQPDTRVFGRGLTRMGLGMLISRGFVNIEDHGIPRMGMPCTLYPEDVNNLLLRLKEHPFSRTRLTRSATGRRRCNTSEMRTLALAVVA